jgi:acyl-coenzyme A thioesterase PaaI-like protein
MQLIPLWQKFSKIPGGKRLFSAFLGRKIPYSGSIHAQIEVLERGRAKVVLPDQRRVRNHLNSVHAIALANLAELSSGLATVAALPQDMRAILIGFKIEYTKKARGRLSADTRMEVPTEKVKKEVVIPVEVKNSDGEVVCRAWATWLIGPVT